MEASFELRFEGYVGIIQEKGKGSEDDFRKQSGACKGFGVGVSIFYKLKISMVGVQYMGGGNKERLKGGWIQILWGFGRW